MLVFSYCRSWNDVLCENIEKIELISALLFEYGRLAGTRYSDSSVNLDLF